MLGVRGDSAARRAQPFPWIFMIVVLGLVVLVAVWLIGRSPTRPIATSQESRQNSAAASTRIDARQEEAAPKLSSPSQPAPSQSVSTPAAAAAPEVATPGARRAR